MTPEPALYAPSMQHHRSPDNMRRVSRVINTMRERFGEEIHLQELADIAYWSPFHFNRMFHEITGLPPVQFLSFLRLQAAKKMLLTTDLSVTDVCFEVGYNGLGTFIRRFTAAVGMSPNRFRAMARGTKLPDMRRSPLRGAVENPRAEIKGRVHSPDKVAGLIFVGLFKTAIPTNQPLSCALMSESGAFRLYAPTDGKYYIYAAAFSAFSEDPLAYLLPDEDMLRVGTSAGPVYVRGKEVSGAPDISLRPLELTDPPILTALPLLAAQYVAQSQTSN